MGPGCRSSPRPSLATRVRIGADENGFGITVSYLERWTLRPGPGSRSTSTPWLSSAAGRLVLDYQVRVATVNAPTDRKDG